MNYSDMQYRDSEKRQGCGKTILISLLTIILVVVAMFFMCSCSDTSVTSMAPGNDQDIPNYQGYIYTMANNEVFHLSHVIYDYENDVMVLFTKAGFERAYFRAGLTVLKSTAIMEYKIMVVVNGNLMYEAETVSYNIQTDSFEINDDLSFARTEISSFEYWQTISNSSIEDEAETYMKHKINNYKTVKNVLSKNIQNQGLL